tara:strand:- start:432 stop:590 length:159 start_codon:yes stop_codon:yes gene_type:complete
MKSEKEKRVFLNKCYEKYKQNKISFDDYLYIEKHVRSEDGKASDRINQMVAG